ncbi:MAG: RNA polymerase sporulation sigma factor SigK [Bacillota bacterium]|nr:RNA polymerase sporulation sigma factor SigK [Bacillota bacterium]
MGVSLWALLGLALLRGLLGLPGYLQSRSSFPQPLSPDEEEAYLKALAEGDADARKKLIEHNMRLVVHVVKKFESTGEDMEDLIGMGAVGLIKAIETFRPEKGTRLATYAARCIENEILMHLRAQKKTRGEVFLQEPLGTDRDGDEISLLDRLAADEEGIAEKVGRAWEAEEVQRMVSRLPSRERAVVVLRYGLYDDQPRTQQEVSSLLGISRSYVSRIEKKALQKMASWAEKLGEKTPRSS